MSAHRHTAPRRLRPLAILLAFASLPLTACAPLVTADQPAADETRFELTSDRPLGQTFVSRFEGLQAVEMFLEPGPAPPARLRLTLLDSPQATRAVASSEIEATSISRPGFYRFAFPPIPASSGRYYYARLEALGQGVVLLPSAGGDRYLDGAAYVAGAPQDAQLTFRLVYEPTRAGWGLAREAVGWAALFLGHSLVFALPGLALLSLLWPEAAAFPWPARWPLAMGVGLALYPLLLLWSHLIGLNLGAAGLWLPVAASLAFLVWQHLRAGPGPRRWRAAALSGDSALADLVLLAVLGLVLLSRFYPLRFLEAPMWGDSYQHTVITQRILESGGLFASWRPYAEMETFTYHFGFHTAAAVLAWAMGLPAPQAVLWAGQVLNVLAVLALYPLAWKLGGTRWAGLTAVLIAGLLSPMPAYYANWGRYTQLAGQVILPAIMLLAWHLLEPPRTPRGLALLTTLALAGLTLTHYRVAAFAGVYLLALLAMAALHSPPLKPSFIRMVSVGLGAGLLTLPWFANVLQGKLPLILTSQLTTRPAEASAWIRLYNAIGDLTTYLPLPIWLLAGAGLLWGLRRRERLAFAIGLWWLLLLLAANPQWLRLPGQGVLTNFAVFIAAYLPASVLVAAIVGWLTARAPLRSRSPLLAALVLVFGFWGLRDRVADIDPARHALVTRPDVRAAVWITDNLPSEAKFLVNAFPAYGGTSVVGSDAGWWLPILAGRQTTLPPLTYVSEQGPRPDYREWVNQLTFLIGERGLTAEEVLQELRARGVTHVYLGQRQGAVNAPPGYRLSPETLLADRHFSLLYHQDRVWIFEFRPDAD